MRARETAGTVRVSAQRMWRRVGWRGLYLILFGVTFILLGVPTPDARPAYTLVEIVMPLWAWARAFQVAGLVALVAGSTFPPPKGVGFGALQAVTSFWGLGITASVLVVDDKSDSVRFGLVWLLVSAATLAVAHLVEPDDALAPVRDAPEGWRDEVRP